jgi:hypothetical protein
LIKVAIYSDSNIQDFGDYFVSHRINHNDIYEENREAQLFNPKEFVGDDRYYLWVKWHLRYTNSFLDLELFSTSGLSAYNLNFNDPFYVRVRRNDNPDVVITFLGHKEINYNLKKFNNTDDVVEKYVKTLADNFNGKKLFIFTPKKPHVDIVKFHEGLYYTHDERMQYYYRFVDRLYYECAKNNIKVINVDDIIKDTDKKGIENCFDHTPKKMFEPLADYLFENIFTKKVEDL